MTKYQIPNTKGASDGIGNKWNDLSPRRLQSKGERSGQCGRTGIATIGCRETFMRIQFDDRQCGVVIMRVF